MLLTKKTHYLLLIAVAALSGYDLRVSESNQYFTLKPTNKRGYVLSRRSRNSRAATKHMIIKPEQKDLYKAIDSTYPFPHYHEWFSKKIYDLMHTEYNVSYPSVGGIQHLPPRSQQHRVSIEFVQKIEQEIEHQRILRARLAKCAGPTRAKVILVKHPVKITSENLYFTLKAIDKGYAIRRFNALNGAMVAGMLIKGPYEGRYLALDINYIAPRYSDYVSHEIYAMLRREYTAGRGEILPDRARSVSDKFFSLLQERIIAEGKRRATTKSIDTELIYRHLLHNSRPMNVTLTPSIATSEDSEKAFRVIEDKINKKGPAYPLQTMLTLRDIQVPCRAYIWQDLCEDDHNSGHENRLIQISSKK